MLNHDKDEDNQTTTHEPKALLRGPSFHLWLRFGSGESFLFLTKEDKTVTTKDTKEHKGMRKT
jgi:hypothetical protein